MPGIRYAEIVGIRTSENTSGAFTYNSTYYSVLVFYDNNTIDLVEGNAANIQQYLPYMRPRNDYENDVKLLMEVEKKIIADLQEVVGLKHPSLSNDDLVKAVHNNDVQTVIKCIETGADVNCIIKGQDADSHVLIEAVCNNNAQIVKILLSNGSDPNAEVKYKDGKCMSALYGAVTLATNVRIVEMLIDAGADPDYMSIITARGAKATALAVAVQRNKIPMIKMLLKKGADPNIETINDDGSHITPLAYANYIHNQEIIHLLASAIDKWGK